MVEVDAITKVPHGLELSGRLLYRIYFFKVVAHNWTWIGMWGAGGSSYWSMRKYNYQARLMVPIIMAYFGVWGGRVIDFDVRGLFVYDVSCEVRT